MAKKSGVTSVRPLIRNVVASAKVVNAVCTGDSPPPLLEPTVAVGAMMGAVVVVGATVGGATVGAVVGARVSATVGGTTVGAAVGAVVGGIGVGAAPLHASKMLALKINMPSRVKERNSFIVVPLARGAQKKNFARGADRVGWGWTASAPSCSCAATMAHSILEKRDKRVTRFYSKHGRQIKNLSYARVRFVL